MRNSIGKAASLARIRGRRGSYNKKHLLWRSHTLSTLLASFQRGGDKFSGVAVEIASERLLPMMKLRQRGDVGAQV